MIVRLGWVVLALPTAKALSSAMSQHWLSRQVGASRVLLIDCHDSYSQNVAAWLACAWRDVYGRRQSRYREWWPTVASHDDLELQAVLREDSAAFWLEWEALVLSPGPGHPSTASDFAESAAGLALASAPAKVPVLGICLGHQGLAWSAGARVEVMQRPRHGILDPVMYDNSRSRLFQGMPQGFKATRYHSLGVVDDELLAASCFQPTAWSPRGDVMAIEHRDLPRFGIQFHPESVATEHGDQIGRNFAELCRGGRRRRHLSSRVRVGSKVPRLKNSWRIVTRDVGRWGPEIAGPEVAEAYYRSISAPSFWLDGNGSTPSIVGDASGPHGFVVSHDVANRATYFSDGRVVGGHELLETLRAELRARRPISFPSSVFNLGFVGYLGYEMRAETSDFSPSSFDKMPSNSTVPDAALIFCARAVIFDHTRRVATSLELTCNDENPSFFGADDDVRKAIDYVAEAAAAGQDSGYDDIDSGFFESMKFVPNVCKQSYARRAREALEAISKGDSYEVCLTATFTAEFINGPPILDWYRLLRRNNRAPRSAFLDLRPFRNVIVASSSPECFLKVGRDGMVEAKPIKGTAPRFLSDDALDAASAASLRSDVKTRAENLMIADLLRNDLLRVCDDASVRSLSAVESFATVHQLVTTLEGRLNTEADALDLVHAAFPPGSMTGAPKRRTCEILHSLEDRQPRRCYSGTLGFFSLDGAADLSVLIRCAVFFRNEQTWLCQVGAGGAITALSKIDDEWAELNLKAEAVVHAFGASVGENDDDTQRRNYNSARVGSAEDNSSASPSFPTPWTTTFTRHQPFLPRRLVCGHRPVQISDSAT